MISAFAQIWLKALMRPLIVCHEMGSLVCLTVASPIANVAERTIVPKLVISPDPDFKAAHYAQPIDEILLRK